MIFDHDHKAGDCLVLKQVHIVQLITTLDLFHFLLCRSSDESADQLFRILQLVSQLEEAGQENKHPEKT